MDEKITALIERSIDQVNKSISPDLKIGKSPSTVLYGDSGGLDSLNMVNFIVILEQEIEQEFNKTLTLADSLALSPSDSPFKTLETLKQFLKQRI